MRAVLSEDEALASSSYSTHSLHQAKLGDLLEVGAGAFAKRRGPAGPAPARASLLPFNWNCTGKVPVGNQYPQR
jgi:hypothetical protein